MFTGVITTAVFMYSNGTVENFEDEIDRAFEAFAFDPEGKIRLSVLHGNRSQNLEYGISDLVTGVQFQTRDGRNAGGVSKRYAHDVFHDFGVSPNALSLEFSIRDTQGDIVPLFLQRNEDGTFEMIDPNKGKTLPDWMNLNILRVFG